VDFFSLADSGSRSSMNGEVLLVEDLFISLDLSPGPNFLKYAGGRGVILDEVLEPKLRTEFVLSNAVLLSFSIIGEVSRCSLSKEGRSDKSATCRRADKGVPYLVGIGGGPGFSSSYLRFQVSTTVSSSLPRFDASPIWTAWRSLYSTGPDTPEMSLMSGVVFLCPKSSILREVNDNVEDDDKNRFEDAERGT
jgi:hypothetical protein